MISFLKNIDSVTLLGIIAGVFTSAAMLPQVIKALKTKDTKDISLFMVILMISGLALWIYYGFRKDDIPIIYTNSFSFLVNVTLLFLHLKYKNHENSSKSIGSKK